MKTYFAIAVLCVTLPAAAVETVRLENGTVVLEVTPSLGGRGLAFGLKDRPNLLRVGAPVQTQPTPTVNALAEDIGYLGHDVWVGPQSAWWSQQHVNPARRDAAAAWPPDPYLAFADTSIIEHTPTRLILEGVESPVSGVRLRKTFALSETRADTVEVRATARNVRDSAVSWDLWFNTRTAPTTRIYVPVASSDDVRVESHAGEAVAPLTTEIADGLFSFARAPLPAGMKTRRGKVFVQPSAGWMAGFAGDQLLVIRFPHQPREQIHPEQGQVELYLDQPAAEDEGLLEMEVHAPYRTLAPGEEMEAVEWWTVLPYPGPDSRQAQVAFLCGPAAQQLGIPELCATSP